MTIPKDEVKQGLLDIFFSLVGNHEEKALTSLMDKMERFLYEERWEAYDEETDDWKYEYDEKIHADPQIKDALRILEIWRNEAYLRSKSYNTYGMNKAIARPILAKLVDKPNWDLFDIKIAGQVFWLSETHKEVHHLAQKILAQLENFSDEKLYIGIKLSVNTNAVKRLTRAKFDEFEMSENLDELTEIFKEYRQAVLEICITDVDRFAVFMTATMLRNRIFFTDNKKFTSRFYCREAFTDKTTNNLELQRILRDELDEYEILARIQAGIPIPKKPYRVFLD